MEAKHYQCYSDRTINNVEIQPTAQQLAALNFALGATGEAGEIADLIKKWVFHGHELDRAEMVKELGDVLWYVSALCSVFGLDLGDVMRANVDKLLARYPDGFSHEASRERGEDLPVTKKCNNPQCQRTTPGNVDYCCRPCRLAHDGGYSVTGLHSPRCDEDASRERGTGGGGQGRRG